MTPFTQGPLLRSIFFGTFTSVSELTGFIKSCVSLCQEGRKEHAISQGFLFFLCPPPASFLISFHCMQYFPSIISFISRVFMWQPVLVLLVHAPRRYISLCAHSFGSKLHARLERWVYGSSFNFPVDNSLFLLLLTCVFPFKTCIFIA